jgi:L-fuculose-phosphate aldolase
MATEIVLRQQIVDIGKQMYDKRFIVATDGNLSIRLSPDRFLVTPSGVCKGNLHVDDLLLVDKEGRKLQGDKKPTSELTMHLCVYRQRSDVQAVIHAHPPFVIACSVAGLSLSNFFLPEVIYSLGTIPTVPYATPGTEAGAGAIQEAIREHDALILPYHGSLTVGRNLEEAFQKLEQMEHVAKIFAVAKHVGKVTSLPAREIAQLFQLAGRGSSVPFDVVRKLPTAVSFSSFLETANAPRLVAGPLFLARKCFRSFTLFSLGSAARLVKIEAKVVDACLKRFQ